MFISNFNYGQDIKSSIKTITLTRESVSAGDDVNAPHKMKIEIKTDWKINEIIEHIVELGYLPKIIGNATWSIAINKPIAVISQHDNYLPKLICLPDYPHQETRGFVDIKNIHINYHGQVDSNMVFEVLHRFRMNP